MAERNLWAPAPHLCAERYATADDARVVTGDLVAVDADSRRAVCRAVADNPRLAGYSVSVLARWRGIIIAQIDADTVERPARGWTGARFDARIGRDRCVHVRHFQWMLDQVLIERVSLDEARQFLRAARAREPRLLHDSGYLLRRAPDRLELVSLGGGVCPTRVIAERLQGSTVVTFPIRFGRCY